MVHAAHAPRHRTAAAIMVAISLLVAGLVPALTAGGNASSTTPHPQRIVVGPSDAAPPATQRPDNTRDNASRGRVYGGLGVSKHCPGGFLLEGTGDVCTHGPDAVGGQHGTAGKLTSSGHDHSAHEHESTDGSAEQQTIDVRNVPTTSQLKQAAGDLLPTSTSTATGQIPCFGDGISGPRVQMVYAVASDRTNRYESLVDTFPVYAARTNAVFRTSAEADGGRRNIRFVHTDDCKLDVLQVVLSPTGDDTFANMVTELRNVGLNRTDRKYMVWVDAGVYCGIASVVQDESSGATNRANAGPAFARVDAACWGSTNSVEAHEIAHTLGAVQLGAPNSNGAWHCTDEYDRLCYNDGSGATMRYACPTDIEALLDCNGDDYFNVSPTAGSYLASHWNLADSVFLSAQLPGTPEPAPSPSVTSTSPSPEPSTSPTASPSPTGPVEVTTTFSGSLNRKQSVKSFEIATGDGPITAVMTFKKVKSMRLSLVAPNSSTTTSSSGASPVRLAASDVSSGNYLIQVDGASSGSFAVTVTYTK